MAGMQKVSATATALLWLVTTSTASSNVGRARFRFFCNSGYSVDACGAHVARLRDELARFELQGFDDWSWILVRSEDWKPILLHVRRDPDSPAFTILERRQTFLEEALFVRIAGRDRTLLEKWRLPLDELFGFALTHELGHAMCRETDEARVEGYAHELRRSGAITCPDGRRGGDRAPRRRP